ncbi:hypothetical protein HRbin28_00526 [bacterium HR28]|nr:hypothetical protein HRbin28_00526 [bacterium HR28]
MVDEGETNVTPDAQSPMDAIEQAMHDIVSLHRLTVNQLGDLIRVQRDTTDQLQAVSEAMRQVGSLFRDMANAQARVNDALIALSTQLERMTEVDDATKQAIKELIDRFQQAVPQLDQLAGQLSGFGVLLRQLVREQERLILSAFRQDLERRLPTLFCRYLASLRWGVPGVFYEELAARLPESAVDFWLAADLVVAGALRQAHAPAWLWIMVFVTPEADEALFARASATAMVLGDVLGTVLPAIAVLRPGDAVGMALSQGILLIADGVLHGWEQAIARWIAEG